MFIRTLLTACAIATMAYPAFADFPEKPIKMIIGYAPGGGTDTYGRALASVAPSYINDQPLIIVNKPGGSGIPAAKKVADSKADGYTLYLASGGSFYFSTQFGKAPVDPFKDFKMVCMIGVHVPAVFVHKESKIKDLKELMAEVKSNPGKLRYSTTGRTSVWSIAALAFLNRNKLDAVGVPAAGGGPARALLIGKQVDFGVIGINLLGGFEDHLRPLAVIHPERDINQKNLATVGELGFQSLEVVTPTILMAPKNVPNDKIAILDSACAKMVKHKAFGGLLKKSGLQAKYRSSADALTYFKSLAESWKPIVDEVKKARKARK